MRMGAQRQVRESRVSLGARQSHHWEMNPPTPPPLIPDPSPLFPGAGRVGSSESGPSPARTARRSQQAALSPQRLLWEEAPSSKPSLLVQPRGPPAGTPGFPQIIAGSMAPSVRGTLTSALFLLSCWALPDPRQVGGPPGPSAGGARELGIQTLLGLRAGFPGGRGCAQQRLGRGGGSLNSGFRGRVGLPGDGVGLSAVCPMVRGGRRPRRAEGLVPPPSRAPLPPLSLLLVLPGPHLPSLCPLTPHSSFCRPWSQGT